MTKIVPTGGYPMITINFWQLERDVLFSAEVYVKACENLSSTGDELDVAFSNFKNAVNKRSSVINKFEFSKSMPETD